MSIAPNAHRISSDATVRDYDAWILFGYLGFAFVALIAIYLAAGSSGYAASDIATMAALP